MGRLTKRRLRLPLPLRRALFNWGLPVVLTLALLFGVHARVRADTPPSTTQLEQYVQTHNLNVFTQTEGDYQQIFYRYNNRSYQITSAEYNHVYPVSSKNYVAWQGLINGESQIYVFDILTSTLTQVTTIGTNSEPYLYQNQVTWRHWNGTDWQIYYYNGLSVATITDGQTSSYRASTDGTRIIYAEQVGADDWKAQSYDIQSGQVSLVAQGTEAATAYPAFGSGGTITTAFVPR